MTSTSTELKKISFSLERAWEAVSNWRGSHFVLGGSHGALQQLLKARNSFQRLAGVVEHVLGGRAWAMAEAKVKEGC
jgi:hypothetical protein